MRPRLIIFNVSLGNLWGPITGECGVSNEMQNVGPYTRHEIENDQARLHNFRQFLRHFEADFLHIFRILHFLGKHSRKSVQN